MIKSKYKTVPVKNTLKQKIDATVRENLEKELHRLQRDLNGSRLLTYKEGDNSPEEMARQRERASKLARFNEVLRLLNEMEDGGEMHKHKEVKANQAIAISEVLKGFPKFKNLAPMEATMLYNLRNEPKIDVPDSGLKEVVYKKLEDKFYLDQDYMDYTYTLTDDAKDFIQKVDNRLETRREVKAGRDLFPETANIPEIKMEDGGDIDFENLPKIDLGDEIKLPEGFEEQSVRMTHDSDWKLKPGQSIEEMWKNELGFDKNDMNKAREIRKHFDNKDFVLGEYFKFSEDEKNVEKAKKYITNFLKKNKDYKYVYNVYSEEPSSNEDEVIPLFSKYKVIGLNPKNQIKDVNVFVAPLKWENTRDGIWVAKKGNIIISLEKGNVGVYSGGEGWRLYIRKKDDLDKKFIAMFWTMTDGSDSWKKPGASVDGKLWEDKYEFYKIKRRAQDILNKEGYLKDGGEIYSNGGSTGNQIGHLEERIQDAFKQPNKWHFINETIDGHTIQMKFFIGVKEVDTQIFKIDGIDMTGKVPGYGKKRETYKAIMDVLEQKLDVETPDVNPAGERFDNRGETIDLTPDKDYEHIQKKKASGLWTDAHFSNFTEQSPAGRVVSGLSGDTDISRTQDKDTNNNDTNNDSSKKNLKIGKFIPIAKIKEITEYYDSHKKPSAGEDPEEAEGYAWLGAMEKYSILGDSTIVETILAEHSFGKSLMDIHKEIKKMEAGGKAGQFTRSKEELLEQAKNSIEFRYLQNKMDKKEYEEKLAEIDAYAKRHNIELEAGGKTKKDETESAQEDMIKKLIGYGFLNEDRTISNKGKRIVDLHKYCFPIGTHPFSYVQYTVDDLYSTPQYILVNDTIFYTDGLLVYELGGHLPESLRDTATQNLTLENQLNKTMSKNVTDYVAYSYCPPVSADGETKVSEGFIVFNNFVNSTQVFVNSMLYNYIIRKYRVEKWQADPNGGSLIYAIVDGAIAAILMTSQNASGASPEFALMNRDQLMGKLRDENTESVVRGISYKDFIGDAKSAPMALKKPVDIEKTLRGLEVLLEMADDPKEMEQINEQIKTLKSKI